MIENNSLPNLVFETSWEVCNKVGGIYTVLTSRAKTLQDILGKDKLVFIGPDIWKDKENPDFKEDTALLPAWREKAEAEGLACRIGRWQIEGQPLCVLVDFQPFFEKKNEIFGEAWAQSGYEMGVLGFPTDDVVTKSGITSQRYEGGVISCGVDSCWIDWNYR